MFSPPFSFFKSTGRVIMKVVPLTVNGFNGYCASLCFDDTFAYCQTKAHTLHLRGEERREQFWQDSIAIPMPVSAKDISKPPLTSLISTVILPPSGKASPVFLVRSLSIIH
jgi:hypothetical protein